MVLRARLQRTLRTTHVAALVCLVLFVSVVWWLFGVARRGAITDEFRPMAQRLTFSTEMSPVDIEVAGSTSLVPTDHKLIPDLVLRLRLARAYVDLYAERQPGFEILNIGLDYETKEPIALFEAVLSGPPFNQGVTGIPRIQPAELRRRGIHLSFQSDARAESLRRFGELLKYCRGQSAEYDLSAYEQVKDCPGLSYRRFGRIAQLEDGLLIKLECDDKEDTNLARCATRFPFKGFIVGLNFSRELLPRWREVVNVSEDFLKSKEYPLETNSNP